MSDNAKKSLFKLGYHAKFIIIITSIFLGIVLLYFAMEYSFEKISPKNNAATVTQSSNQNTTVIEE